MESMTVHPDIDQVIARLRVLMPELQARFHVERMALFGSYVHGTQTPKSDLDVLVSFGEVPSLLRFLQLEDFLSDTLEIKVDLVMEEALKPTIGRHILRELVPV